MSNVKNLGGQPDPVARPPQDTLERPRGDNHVKYRRVHPLDLGGNGRWVWGGEYSWGGAAGTWFWINPVQDLIFVGIDYAVDNRSAEEVILPLAQDQGIGVLVYVPFGRSRLFSRVGDRELPEWARPFAGSWAQFFIEFAAAHPAVTTVTPATSQARHMVDNLGGARRRLPNPDEVKRIVELVGALPSGG